MRQQNPAYLGFFLIGPLLLAHCGNNQSASGDDAGSNSGGSSGQATGGKGGGSAGKGGSGGSTGGTGGAGGSTGGSGGSTGGSGGSVGGTGGTGGSTGGSGGTGGTGGSTGGTGGSTGGAGGTGGSTGGAGGSTGGTGGSTGGAGGIGGTSGGMGGSAGAAAGASSCAATDMNNKANWTPGAMTSTAMDYLRSCDIRLLNNNWGAKALGCNSAQYSVFVNNDGSFGWNFNRPDCDTANSNAKPDFPEIEFGVHPFGAGSSDATSPDFSSTTLMPIQIKDIKSMSIQINNLSVQLQQSASWDLTFELWVSQQNPLGGSPGVYAELMTFWGWEANRWPESCPMEANSICKPGSGQTFLPGDNVSAGSKNYKLEVQADNWANGKWRYFQFRSSDGPSTSFNGKLDVKALTDYLVNTRKYSSDFWITRLEVGTEIDDQTSGKATIDSITFEVNGQTRSAGKM